jgi:hypothetical protein
MFALRKTSLSILTCLSLTLHICSAFGEAQIIADANQFPLSLKTEAFSDHSITLKVSFKVFFPKDSKRYVPVSPTLAQFLASPPDVYAKPELRVRIIKTECIPDDVVALVDGDVVMGKGGIINCEIEIAPLQSVKRGVYDIRLAFVMIDTTFNMLDSTESFPKAVALIQVETWPSLAVKQETLLAAETARKRKEEVAAQARRQKEEADALARRQKEEADALARRQKEEAEAQARHEARIRLLKVVSPFLGLGLFLALVVFLKRKWIWPDFKVAIPAGTNLKFDSIRRVHHGVEAGTILQTAWAKTLYGTRQRIKVETFAADSLHADARSDLDMLVSVGASVRPGAYLARLPSGGVRVNVSKGSSQ